MDICIRKAKQNDIEDILALSKSCYKKYKFKEKFGMEFEDESWLNKFSKSIESEDGHLYVASVNNEIKGLLMCVATECIYSSKQKMIFKQIHHPNTEIINLPTRNFSFMSSPVLCK